MVSMFNSARIRFHRAVRRNLILGSAYAVVSVVFGRKSYLRRQGWWQSFRKRVGINASGEPIPWMTYPLIEFLSARVNPAWAVFEYGSGNSTLWWAERVASIQSCEHDQDWFSRIKSNMPGNVILELNQGQDYARELSKFEDVFDVVVIDGIDRCACASYALRALKKSGVVIWDNSEKDKYRSGIELLEDAGFRRIDFSGPGPAAAHGWTTSIFYRDNNCLGI